MDDYQFSDGTTGIYTGQTARVDCLAGLRISQGKLTEVICGACADTAPQAFQRLVTPGLMDMHIHGFLQCCFEAEPETWPTAARALAQHGTTTILPTIVPTVSGAEGFARLARLAGALDSVSDCTFAGLHLEGPFMALAGAGCATVAGDVGLLREIYDACGGRLRVMSLSPEVENIVPVIEWLVARGVVPFITHTAATVEQTERAIAAGARHATHFYDVFPLPPATDGGVRPVGVVETFLATPGCSVDFIADGVHVHPMAIRAAVAAKGCGQVMLVTDANIGAGLPPGTYDTPWGFAVAVKPDGGARVATPGHAKFGSLAGSGLTMDAGMNNLLRWLDQPEAEVWAMGTANPARLLGLTDKGRLIPGADADFVLWEKTDQGYRVVRTWVGGRCVYADEASAPGFVRTTASS